MSCLNSSKEGRLGRWNKCLLKQVLNLFSDGCIMLFLPIHPLSIFLSSLTPMYERESEVVRLGVEFLTALTEKDYLTDPSFDALDLEKRLNEIQVDINFLISNLPVEAIDDDREREEEYAGDFEDSEELEDEVVECERLIAQATKLMAEVREHYLPI